MTHNPNCDGNECLDPNGEVRVYPLGGGSNLILCHRCWALENKYRHLRGVEVGDLGNWPQVDWTKAEVYNGA